MKVAKPMPGREHSPSADIASQESDAHGPPSEMIPDDNHIYGDIVRVGDTAPHPSVFSFSLTVTAHPDHD